ncbi:hypothetical protein [Nocardioides perillae]|uniref:Uncharacterized protein n=1 Tax=Nocardioides perillae TaxID=1119534 RepID=A0A7Y9RTS3_9ACTN|nr:hypothetical protein [Nocardioides perillae]NYG54738.1 hypothetical protein [Nocardioides perillae]
MLRLTVATPDDPAGWAAPTTGGPAAPLAAPLADIVALPTGERPGRTTARSLRPARAAYAASMRARCALARLLRAGHREPPRHRAQRAA